MRLGILGGTFDPVHFAHLLMAEEARVRLDLERVLLVPNATPPHKRNLHASAEDRAAMVALAIDGNGALELSRAEMDRPGRSYTVDTLIQMEHDYPGAELYFITGSDALAEIGTWRQPAEVTRRCTLVCFEREGWTLQDLAGVLDPQVAARVVGLGRIPLLMSSTDIRDRVARGRPIRYLTPDPVVQYIGNRGLYRPDGVGSRSKSDDR